MSWFDDNADPTWTGADASASDAPAPGGPPPNIDFSQAQLGYGQDLTPIAAQYGMTRDQLSGMRDDYWKPKIQQFRSQYGNQVADDDQTAIAQLSGQAQLRNGSTAGNNLSAFAPGGSGSAQGYQPFTQTFNGPQMPSDLGDKWDQSFAWDPSKAMDDPALQARMATVQKQRERYAAANGTLLTGGTTAALDKALVGEALQGENDDFGRSLSQYQNNFSTFTTDKNRRQGVFQGQFDNARNSFLDAANIYDRNESGRVNSGLAIGNQNLAAQGQAFNQNRATTLDNWQRDDTLYGRDYTANRDNTNDTFRLADYGYGAATNLGNFATNYGRGAGNTAEDIGNATAAGQVGSANAWANGIQGAVNGATAGYLASRTPTPTRRYYGDVMPGGVVG